MGAYRGDFEAPGIPRFSWVGECVDKEGSFVE